MCGRLQQHSREEPLRRGCLESQDQVHNRHHFFELNKSRALTEEVMVDDVEADEEGSLVHHV